MHKSIVCVAILVPALASCQSRRDPAASTNVGKTMQIKVTSSAFVDGGLIPAKYTCDGTNVSPPVSWTNIPTAAKTIALICDDPDARARVWVHWVLFNLPASITELAENVPPDKNLGTGAKQGTNDFGKIGYGGPCPPSGTHRYYFKLYALDTELELPAGATKPQLLEAMKGHILAEGQLIGKYSRK